MFNSKLIVFVAAASSLTAFAEISIEKQKELDAMKDRPVLLSREMITDPAGYKYIVEHWKNPGEHQKEWVTNKAWKVNGKVQTTTWKRQMDAIKVELDEANVEADKARKVEKSALKAKKKDTKNFNKWIDDTEKAKKKSSEDMAEFYDAILELAKIYDVEDN